MKILILGCYFNRPKTVRLALESVKSQSYEDWELVFVDDGSESFALLPVFDEFFSGDIRAKVVNTGHSIAIKNAMGGSAFGQMWNVAMEKSDADIAIMLCDDDALYPDYLSNLNKFYSDHPEIVYSYGHVGLFNPIDHDSLSTVIPNFETGLNVVGPIYPWRKVDASQVSWRLKPVVESSVRFPYPQTLDLDASLYDALYRQFGDCQYNGIITQYKGWHVDQMTNRRAVPYEIKDI